jgi:hypothetical protein
MYAQKHYTPDIRCCDITTQILDLKTVTAKKNIHAQLQLNPENHYLYYLDQYADFVQLLVAPNEERYETLKTNYETYREIMDDKDTDSPYYLFILSTMQLQLSLTRMKFGETWSGARLAYKSYRNMQRNIDRYPDFYGNKKLRGLFNVMLKNLPPFLRTVATLFGVRPGRESTFNLLSAYKEDIKDKPGLSTEASIFIALSYLLDKKNEEAFLYISSLEETHFKVFLVRYFYGTMAYHTSRNEKALSAFKSLSIEECEVTFYPYYFLYGKILMNKLDPSANTYLQTFVDETSGIDYLKQAYLYLAFYYLMDDNQLKYMESMLNVERLGDDKTERDRDALADSRRGYAPDTTLLKTSLLVKGGYYQEAEEVLLTYPLFNNIFLPYELEFNLLKGQIQEGLSNPADAIVLYLKVIADGADEKQDFATRASLHTAQIYEKEKEYDRALKYYEMARDLYRSEYYESLEGLAKKGIERMEDQTVTNE